MVCAGLLAIASIASCTSANPAASTAAALAARPVVVSAGAILSLRTVTADNTALPWRSALLTDASAANTANDSGNARGGHMQVVEFIVRTDGGAVLSVVQANDADFHAGDRVMILRGDATRLARPG
jgi:outer membrane lipoprotein SlyB